MTVCETCEGLSDHKILDQLLASKTPFELLLVVEIYGEVILPYS